MELLTLISMREPKYILYEDILYGPGAGGPFKICALRIALTVPGPACAQLHRRPRQSSPTTSTARTVAGARRRQGLGLGLGGVSESFLR
jgi:hypothetical protein